MHFSALDRESVATARLLLCKWSWREMKNYLQVTALETERERNNENSHSGEALCKLTV